MRLAALDLRWYSSPSQWSVYLLKPLPNQPSRWDWVLDLGPLEIRRMRGGATSRYQRQHLGAALICLMLALVALLLAVLGCASARPTVPTIQVTAPCTPGEACVDLFVQEGLR